MAMARLRVLAKTRSTTPRSSNGPNTSAGRRGLLTSRASSRGPRPAPTPMAASSNPNPPGPTPRWRPANTTSRALVAPADRAASSCTSPNSRSSRSATSSRAPSPTWPNQEPAAVAAGWPGGRSPTSSSAEAAKLAALTRNAGATPTVATRAPARGASAIWEMTAADHRPLLAATSSSSSTMLGSTELAAGLKNTPPAASPKATT
jgi:hypothetical protein